MSDNAVYTDLYFFHEAQQLSLYYRVWADIASRYIETLTSTGWRLSTAREHRLFVDRERRARWKKHIAELEQRVKDLEAEREPK